MQDDIIFFMGRTQRVPSSEGLALKMKNTGPIMTKLGTCIMGLRRVCKTIIFFSGGAAERYFPLRD